VKLIIAIIKKIIDDVFLGAMFNPKVPVLSWAEDELIQAKRALKE